MKPLAIRSILVATDLGSDMVPALRSARQLADLADAELHIVHAGTAPAQHADIDARVDALAELVGCRLDVSLLAGPPAAAITQEAARTHADVIILGRHRSRAGAPGSTADRVVRTARAACLILPVELHLPLASVLVPVDIRNAAGPLGVALTWASALRSRARQSTRVDVLYVHVGDGGNEQSLGQQLRSEVSAIEQRVANIALVDIAHHVEHSDDVPSAILQRADTSDVSLIVLGTRAQRIADDPLGSVSSGVTRQAARPILLVPPEVWSPAAEQIP